MAYLLNPNIFTFSSFSESCKPMEVVTPLEDEFVRVICTSKYWPWSMDVTYRNFHAVPLPNRSSKTTNKLSYWKYKHESRTKSSSSRNSSSSSDRSSNDPPFSTRSSSVHPSQKLSPEGSGDQPKESGPPPNVVLLGIDSMSRLSFQRNMKKTRQFLQSIGAVEMLGYTKGIRMSYCVFSKLYAKPDVYVTTFS